MSQFSHLFTLNDPGLFINIALVLLFVILTTSISTPYTLLDTRIRLAQERDFCWVYDTLFFLSHCNPNMFITIFTIAMHWVDFSTCSPQHHPDLPQPLFPTATIHLGCSYQTRSSNHPFHGVSCLSVAVSTDFHLLSSSPSCQLRPRLLKSFSLG